MLIIIVIFLAFAGQIVEAGDILVTSSPSKAYVFIDGQAVGQTPYKASNLPLGIHKVVIYRSGFAASETEMMISSSEKSTVHGSLKKSRSWKSPPGIEEIVWRNFTSRRRLSKILKWSSVALIVPSLALSTGESTGNMAQTVGQGMVTAILLGAGAGVYLIGIYLNPDVPNATYDLTDINDLSPPALDMELKAMRGKRKASIHLLTLRW